MADSTKGLALILINLKADKKIERIRVLTGLGEVTAVAYGPYDNGFLILGLHSGRLLMLDPQQFETHFDFKISD